LITRGKEKLTLWSGRNGSRREDKSNKEEMNPSHFGKINEFKELQVSIPFLERAKVFERRELTDASQFHSAFIYFEAKRPYMTESVSYFQISQPFN